MMIAGLIAPGMQSTHASAISTPSEFCNSFSDGQFPDGIGVVESDNVLVKCFDASDPCFTAGIPMKSDVPTQCSFGVVGGSVFGDSVIILDAIPAEWEVVDGDAIGCTGMEANTNGQDKSNGKAKANRSAGIIECVAPPFALNGFSVLVETRESPSGKFFKPTFCGTFALNEGAVMLLGDENGDPVLEEVEPGVFEPIVLAETGPLEVEAVGEACEV